MILDCSQTAVVKGFAKAAKCPTRILLVQLGVISASEIDTDNITEADGEITALALTGGATWEEMQSDIKKSSLVITKDESTGIYTSVLTIDLNGFSKEIRDAAINIDGFCDLVFWTSTSTCQNRIIGLDKVGTKWKTLLTSKLTGHVETMGGANDASNVVTFTSESVQPPFFTSLTDADIFPVV